MGYERIIVEWESVNFNGEEGSNEVSFLFFIDNLRCRGICLVFGIIKLVIRVVKKIYFS